MDTSLKFTSGEHPEKLEELATETIGRARAAGVTWTAHAVQYEDTGKFVLVVEIEPAEAAEEASKKEVE